MGTVLRQADNALTNDGDTGSADSAATVGRTAFGRLWRNVMWLLGGRGVAGVVSIAYLAFAARSLGPTGFGFFSIVLAYGGAIASLAQFQPGQAIIRYGSVHLEQDRRDRLARLIGFTATLDWLSGAAGAIAAAIGVPLIGGYLAWTSSQQHGAELFGAVLLLSTGGTATGALRVFNRFDLLVYAEMVGPFVRLFGALAVWLLRGGVGEMLVAWSVAAFAEMIAGWIALFRTRRIDFAFGPASFAAAMRENPGIWGFMLKNSFASSLGVFGQQLGTLAVGLCGGAAAAGGFRVAGKLANAISKPMQIVTRALYPELARFAAGGDVAALRGFASHTTRVAMVAAAAVVAIAWFAGPALLVRLSGEGFAFAAPLLFILTIAAAIDLCGMALEPVLNVTGAASEILIARVIGALSYFVALAALIEYVGVLGACIAAVIGSAARRVSLAIAAARIFRRGLPRLQPDPADMTGGAIPSPHA